MARPLRIAYPGASYHVMARGNERRRIFHTVKDYESFLKTLRQMARVYNVRIQAYCLMPNHYHLALTTPDGNLSKAVGWFQTTFTIRYNRRHQRSGHLFQGRYKAHVVGSEEYGKELVRYIHLNPVRPRDKKKKIQLTSKSRLSTFRWSSHQDYLGKRNSSGSSEWLAMEWHRLWGKNKKKANVEYRRDILSCFDKLIEPLWEKVKGGLVLGSQSLIDKTKELLKKKPYQDEREWVEYQEYEEKRKKLGEELKKEKDAELQIWLRVNVGGEKKVAIARDYGYRDGSGLFYVLKKIEKKAAVDLRYRGKLDRYRRKFKV